MPIRSRLDRTILLVNSGEEEDLVRVRLVWPILAGKINEELEGVESDKT